MTIADHLAWASAFAFMSACCICVGVLLGIAMFATHDPRYRTPQELTSALTATLIVGVLSGSAVAWNLVHAVMGE